MAIENNDIKLGRIRGFLEAFEIFNSKTDHVYSFAFDVLDKLESVEPTLHEYVSRFVGDIHPNSFKLNPLADAKAQLQASLTRWLFSFLPENDTHYHLVDAHQNFTLWDEELRQDTFAELTELILEVAQPLTAYQVEFHPVEWYECDWEDFALESQNQVFYLHLGVSD